MDIEGGDYVLCAMLNPIGSIVTDITFDAELLEILLPDDVCDPNRDGCPLDLRCADVGSGPSCVVGDSAGCLDPIELDGTDLFATYVGDFTNTDYTRSSCGPDRRPDRVFHILIGAFALQNVDVIVSTSDVNARIGASVRTQCAGPLTELACDALFNQTLVGIARGTELFVLVESDSDAPISLTVASREVQAHATGDVCDPASTATICSRDSAGCVDLGAGPHCEASFPTQTVVDALSDDDPTWNQFDIIDCSATGIVGPFDSNRVTNNGATPVAVRATVHTVGGASSAHLRSLPPSSIPSTKAASMSTITSAALARAPTSPSCLPRALPSTTWSRRTTAPSGRTMR
ncbi:MAG: hypothetical protein Q8O67_28985 [Deltaproteobacteria bacterium]|nr:hypothetical protein [Deltaproteobacteria bacterium]